jgi:hypothetical protein
MKIEFEKKMRIAGDLLSYCHFHGAVEYHLDMTKKDGVAMFIINASPVELSEEEMARLQKELSAERQREMEQDFWALMGESEDFSELNLVGMMCDEVEIKYADKVLTIILKRFD